MRVFFLLFVMLFLSNSVLSVEEMTLDQLLEKNRAAVSEINQLALTYAVSSGNESGTYQWFYSPSAEFLEYVPSKNEENGSRHDFLFTGPEHHVFSTVATREEFLSFHPKSLTESLNSGIGITAKSTDFSMDFYSPKAEYLVMSVRSSQSDTGYLSLAEFVRNAPWSSSPERSLNSRGETIWTIYLADEPIGEKNKSWEDLNKSFTRIDFNENQRYGVERFLSFVPSSSSPVSQTKTKETIPFVSEIVVSEFMTTESGKPFPKKIFSGYGTPWARQSSLSDYNSIFYKNVCDILEVKLNSSVPLKPVLIPEYTKVSREDRTVLEKSGHEYFVPVSFWGANNQPSVTLNTEKEYDQYVKSLFAKETPVPQATFFSFWRIFLFGLGIALILYSIMMKVRHGINANT